jgi:hypothetical protein
MTIPDPDLNQVSFHEAGLVGIIHSGGIVTLALEDVRFGNIPRAAEVTVEGVVSILRNGQPILDLRMEEKDGEVLTLRKEQGQVLLAIQWDDFVAKSHEVVAYTLDGPKLTLRVTPSA